MGETRQLVFAVRELLGGNVREIPGAQRVLEHSLEISRGGSPGSG
jgi:hypothetical protein